MKFEHSSIQAESSEANFHNIIRLLAESGGRLSLAEAAQMAGLSACRFSHVFKEAKGFSFREARQRAKLEMAASLLSVTGLRVARIAEISGYSDLSKFGVAFRRHFGVSPRSFRNGCA